MGTRPDVVLVDHRDSYTHNLAHLVAAVTGVLPRVVQHDEVDADDVLSHSHVVLSPGPGHPGSPTDFAVGRAVLATGTRPVLGVCLGLQGLVTVHGGEVTRRRPAHGEVARVEHDGRGVLAGLPQGFAAVRYHSLGVVRLPACLEVTATCADDEARDGGHPDGPAERVVMGVRHRDLPQEAVQFHPESVLSEHGEALVRNFLSAP
ncbi:aminodeoxychorismate/anthranilate synthase component II [Nocardioides zeae]|uniref:Aminodeoxychorismate/anthranilate synthase component II n=1 Tax=Nocardioides imazamoxiresistens TaxID=3231893 RepID=A0ABU3PVI5_9ACTN|nr:aminodeoxychorismate/anthranilate synthase component II [Nocardioides zeae]MDT9592827.1 aminodeoxychorismate/anthranilate synthase component II [Nocardioides zeae]